MKKVHLEPKPRDRAGLITLASNPNTLITNQEACPICDGKLDTIGGHGNREYPLNVLHDPNATQLTENHWHEWVIGNGGSATVASHQAIDYWRNGNIPAITFNDSALMTCISNDFGYEQVFSKPISTFAQSGDILFAISSSGQSANILTGVRQAIEMDCHVITLSAFQPNNPLRRLGHLNFYVPTMSYGFAEIMHLCICHCIIDGLIQGALPTTGLE